MQLQDTGWSDDHQLQASAFRCPNLSSRSTDVVPAVRIANTQFFVFEHLQLQIVLSVVPFPPAQSEAGCPNHAVIKLWDRYSIQRVVYGDMHKRAC